MSNREAAGSRIPTVPIPVGWGWERHHLERRKGDSIWPVKNSLFKAGGVPAVTPPWDGSRQEKHQGALLPTRKNHKPIKDGGKLALTGAPWPAFIPTVSIWNSSDYLKWAADGACGAPAALPLFLAAFPGSRAASRAARRGCWVLRAEWDAPLLVLSYFFRSVTPGGALIGDGSRWSSTKAGKEGCSFCVLEKGKRERSSLFFPLLSWAMSGDIKEKGGRFPKQWLRKRFKDTMERWFGIGKSPFGFSALRESGFTGTIGIVPG